MLGKIFLNLEKGDSKPTINLRSVLPFNARSTDDGKDDQRGREITPTDTLKPTTTCLAMPKDVTALSAKRNGSCYYQENCVLDCFENVFKLFARIYKVTLDFHLYR